VKVSSQFSVAKYTFRQARKLQKEYGILPSVSRARGKPLAAETVKVVKEFYREDDVSRIMPGIKGLCVC